MKNKSQITMFVMVGFLILLLFTSLFYIVSAVTTKNPVISSEFQPIKLYFDGCLKNTAEEGVFLLTRNGGRVDELVYDNIPTIEMMEIELSDYITKNIGACLEDIEFFEEKGFTFIVNEYKTNVLINIADINFELNWPIKIIKDQRSQRIYKFKYSYEDIVLPYLREIAIDMLNNENYIDMTYLSNIETNVNILPIDNSIIYSLSYEEIKFNFGENI